MGTQADRLLAFLRSHPGASSLEITQALALVNVTGRVSDLRARGLVIEAQRVKGVYRYWLIEQPVQMAAFG